MKERLCIIGGVEAGLTAAAQARRNDPGIEILVFEKTDYISYGLCGLPYFISGAVGDIKDLFLYSPSYFKENRNINVLTGHRVRRIDCAQRKLDVEDQGSPGQVKEFFYDKLIIATGARAIRPSGWPGADLKNIFTLRDLSSAVEMKETIREEKPENAVIVGSGLIGLAMAESFRSLGLRTAVLEKEEQILPLFSRRTSERVREELKNRGVEVLTGARVDGFTGTERVEKVSVNGKSLPADIVLLSIGVVPETDLASSAGIELEPLTRAVKVNRKMAVSVPRIWAAGDCVHSTSVITGKPVYMPLAAITDKQAQIAANNATGKSSLYRGTVGTLIEKVFGLQVARTGLTEKQLLEERIDYVTREVRSSSRARYYPGSEPIGLTLFLETGSKKILGAEMTGKEGVDKRIDVLGLAILQGLRNRDLYDLDMAYTPAYAPSRDILWLASLK